jgi:hypothetical protein
MATLSECQKFVKKIAALVPNQQISVIDTRDERHPEFKHSNDFEECVDSKIKIRVRVANFGDFSGTPDSILADIKKKADARAAF